MDRIARQESVAGLRLNITVSKQLGDYWQCLPEYQRTGSESVTEVVLSNVLYRIFSRKANQPWSRPRALKCLSRFEA